MRIAIYPGSFDPITNGHLDVLHRATQLFDRVYIAVLRNQEKRALFTVEERLRMIEESTAGMPGVSCETFAGLAVEYARSRNAVAIVRGLRAVGDFEAELKMAIANDHLAPEIEMVYLMTSMKYSFLSSSIVKEVASMGGRVDDWVPHAVLHRLKEKYNREGSRPR